ncbi:MAG: hypothetical protein ETSY1_32295, partial [Candidatus Entotheonella factor]
MKPNHDETRDVVVIMGLRCTPLQPERRRNAQAVLRALNHQSLERWRYRIVIVEQDVAPRLREALRPFYDQYIFTYNPGLYNRAWAFNVGAVLPGSRTGALCLIDGDLLVAYDFLQAGLTELATGAQAIQPFEEIVFLDELQSRRAIRDRNFVPGSAFDAKRYHGCLYRGCMGGCLWVDVG